MNYKYKEALERAKKLKETCDSTAVVGWCEYLFPELKESEDGKIKKALMKFIEKFPYERLENDGVSVKDALAWLEKQSEQPKEATYTHEVETGNGNIKALVTEKVQLPKFKVGDWVVYTGYLLKDSGKEIYVMQVASVEDDRYHFTDTSILCFDSEKDMRSWTISSPGQARPKKKQSNASRTAMRT